MSKNVTREAGWKTNGIRIKVMKQRAHGIKGGSSQSYASCGMSQPRGRTRRLRKDHVAKAH